MARRVQAIAWDWTHDGAIITVNVDGQLVEWMIPLHHVQLTFGKQMARVGCPLAPTVGAPSVGGLFGSISKAFKSASRAVKKAVPKAVRRATSSIAKAAERGASSLYKGAKSYGQDAWNVAKRLRDPKQAALAMMTAGSSLAAQTKLHQKGLQLARHIPGPIGMGARAAVPMYDAMGRFAQGKDPRLLKNALAFGQSAVNYYAPGVQDQVLGRIAPSVKKSLMGLTNVQKLTKNLPLPTSKQVATAQRVWHAVNDAESAAKRLKLGRANPWDALRLNQGQRTLANLRNVVAHAQAGNQPARRAIHAFRRVGGWV